MTFQDMTITAKVKAAFVKAQDVNAMDIDVDVHNGVVNLKGDVSKKAHDQAIQVTKGVEGVEVVEDNLKITSD